MTDYSYLKDVVKGDPAELEEFLADPYLVFSMDQMCRKNNLDLAQYLNYLLERKPENVSLKKFTSQIFSYALRNHPDKVI